MADSAPLLHRQMAPAREALGAGTAIVVALVLLFAVGVKLGLGLPAERGSAHWGESSRSRTGPAFRVGVKLVPPPAPSLARRVPRDEAASG